MEPRSFSWARCKDISSYLITPYESPLLDLHLLYTPDLFIYGIMKWDRYALFFRYLTEKTTSATGSNALITL